MQFVKEFAPYFIADKGYLEEHVFDKIRLPEKRRHFTDFFTAFSAFVHVYAILIYHHTHSKLHFSTSVFPPLCFLHFIKKLFIFANLSTNLLVTVVSYCMSSAA